MSGNRRISAGIGAAVVAALALTGCGTTSPAPRCDRTSNVVVIPHIPVIPKVPVIPRPAPRVPSVPKTGSEPHTTPVFPWWIFWGTNKGGCK